MDLEIFPQDSRRAYERRQLELPVTVAHDRWNRPPAVWQAHTVDISPGGMGLVFDSELENGDVVTVRIQNQREQGRNVVVRAIVRYRSDVKHGLEIIDGLGEGWMEQVVGEA